MNHASRTLSPSLAAATGLTLVVAASAGLVIWAGWAGVAGALSGVSPTAMAGALLLSLACYVARFCRWAVFLRMIDCAIAAMPSFKIYVSGLAFSWTPGKAGEVLRAVFLRRHGVSLPRAFMLFYWDRLSDLAGMVLLVTLGAFLVGAEHGWLIAGCTAIAGMLWLARPGGRVFSRTSGFLRRHAPRRAKPLLRGLQRLSSDDSQMTVPLAAFAVAAGSTAYWIQSLGLVVIADSIGVDVGLGLAILVMSLSTLAGAVFALPAGGGVVEVSSVALLMANGVAPSDAVAIGLAHRLATFWFATALGGVFFLALARARNA